MPLPGAPPPRIRYHRIRTLRLAQGIPASRLADALGKTRGWLYQAERGELALTIPQLVCLAELLGAKHFWDLVDVDLPPELRDEARQVRQRLRTPSPRRRRTPRD